MSRTYKDRKSSLRFPHSYWRHDWGWSEDGKYGGAFLHYPTTKPKQRRTLDSKYRWYARTPGWWVNEFMERPYRRKNTLWEAEIKKVAIEDFEDFDYNPKYSRKPHVYYY